MPPALPAPVPELPVADLAAATAYYAQRLGFAIDWADEALGLAGVSRDGCRLFLAARQFRARDDDAGRAVTWLNLASGDEVDALHRAWVASGARIASAPERKPWGLHEFTALDGDGNAFRVFHDFATPAREAGEG